MKNEVTIAFIREKFGKKSALGDAMHRKIMLLFQVYLLVVGMPQVVEKYVETGDFSTPSMALH